MSRISLQYLWSSKECMVYVTFDTYVLQLWCNVRGWQPYHYVGEESGAEGQVGIETAWYDLSPARAANEFMWYTQWLRDWNPLPPPKEYDVEPDYPYDPEADCAHDWVCTGTAYGGDDERYHGEGRVYCTKCGADGDG